MKCSKIILTLQAATMVCLFAFVTPAMAQTNAGHGTVASPVPNAQTAALTSTLTGNWKRQETAKQKAARFKAIDLVTSKMGK